MSSFTIGDEVHVRAWGRGKVIKITSRGDRVRPDSHLTVRMEDGWRVTLDVEKCTKVSDVELLAEVPVYAEPDIR